MKHPYIVFDLDGTLVESLPGICDGLNRALISLNKAPRTLTEISGMIGLGARSLCAQALGYSCTEDTPEEELYALLNAFTREYPHCWQGKGTHIFPGVPLMLQRLHSRGAKLAILSNKPHDVTELIVQKLFINNVFLPVLGHQEGILPRKPHPAALHHIAKLWNIPTEELILVGDSIHDAKTAQAAGCALALVPWGYSKIEHLLEWRAQHGSPIFGSMENLSNYLLQGKE